MNVKELMSGDYLLDSKVREIPQQVTRIVGDLVMLEVETWRDPNELQPIPVTKEWLKLNGWEFKDYRIRKSLSNGYCVEFAENYKHFTILVYNPIGINTGLFICKYVHELQNGIRLIIKQDLDLKFE